MFNWLNKTPVRTVERFIDAMNARDFKRVEGLLANDVRLIDTANHQLRGREPVMALLLQIAEMAPDYRLERESVVARGEDILVSGKAISSNAEAASASQWRARAENGKLLEWQSYGNVLGPSLIAKLHEAT